MPRILPGLGQLGFYRSRGRVAVRLLLPAVAELLLALRLSLERVAVRPCILAFSGLFLSLDAVRALGRSEASPLR